jgi:transcriptional regulator with XRE-family HTH domain
MRYHKPMAQMGATKASDSAQLAGNLLRLARQRRGVSQRRLAELAGVPQSTVARIETHRQQPTLPLLGRLLAAADLELRTRLADYDPHDDVLDTRRATMTAAEQDRVSSAQDRFAATGRRQ